MISTVDGRPPRSLSADERYLIEDRLWRRQIILVRAAREDRDESPLGAVTHITVGRGDLYVDAERRLR